MTALEKHQIFPFASEEDHSKNIPKNFDESRMKIVLNFLYYCCLCPFKVIPNTDGHYALKYNKIQRMTCAVVYLSGSIQAILFVVWLLQSGILKDNSDVSGMMEIIGNAASAAGALCLTRTIWLGHTNILHFLEITRIKNRTSDRFVLSRIWPVGHFSYFHFTFFQ